MGTLSVGEAREQFADLISKAAFGKERFIITKHGRERVAVIPIEDLRALERYEEEVLLSKTREALEDAKEHGTISIPALKEKYGL
jgi:prevent-host-death family protein